MTEPIRSHRSVSQINTYLGCSEAYRLKYVDKPPIPPMPAAWLAQGTAYHETIDIWENSGRSPHVDLTWTFTNLYDTQIAQMKEMQPDLRLWLKAPKKKTEDDIAERRVRGLKQVQDYVDYAEENPFYFAELDEWTLGIEVPFEVTLGGVLIRGGIDQIRLIGENPFDGVHVVDLKTGNRESASIQLGTYKIAVEKIFGWPVKKASFFYAKDSKLVGLDKTDLDRYTEAYVTELYQALDRGIENKVFIPNPGGQCLLCPVKKFCREYA